MIFELNEKEWGRLRNYAKDLTRTEFRQASRMALASIATGKDVHGKRFVSEYIARECEKWCKQ